MKTKLSLLVIALSSLLLLADYSQADDKKKTKDGGVVKVLVPDMVCEGCSSTVTKALKGIDGVTTAEVNLKHKVALIDTKATVDDNTLTQAVEKTGYKVQKIERVGFVFQESQSRAGEEVVFVELLPDRFIAGKGSVQGQFQSNVTEMFWRTQNIQ